MPTRRHVLVHGSAALAALALPRFALAAAPTDRRLVIVLLRGAMDGLAAVPPYADPDYGNLRRDLALPEPGREGGVLDLDGFFGLHPALPFLGGRFRSGDMAVVHAAATPYRERSHFDGQDVLENGADTAARARDGWLNRALALFPGQGEGTALAVAQSPPLILRGEVPSGSWAPGVLPAPPDAFLDSLAMLYDDDPLLGPALREGMRLQALGGGPDMTGKPAPADALDALTRPVGRMLADARGPRLAVFETTGWDTHASQGAAEGALANRFKSLDAGLAALHEALGEAWARTAVLVVTEFGRTAAMNGTKGTDHGTASAAFVLGGAVAGGRVLGPWPGLAAERLYQGRDLAPASDLRALFAAALTAHLGLPAADVAGRVFPGGPAGAPFADLFAA